MDASTSQLARAGRRGGVSAMAAVLAVMLAFEGVARADDEPATPQLFADYATTRSQIYEGFIALIDGLQEGGTIDAWAKEYLDTAFDVAKKTVETIKYVTFFSIPGNPFGWVMFVKGMYDQANVTIGLYNDITSLMDNWSDGFIAGDLKLIWNNTFMFYDGHVQQIEPQLAEMKELTLQEAGLWTGLATDLVLFNDLKALLAVELGVVEEALVHATFMANTAQQWKDAGKVPNTFVCQFGEPSACQQLINTNVGLTTSLRDFLLAEQAYLSSMVSSMEPVEVECNPGAAKSEPCGTCGQATYVCSAEAAWPAEAACDDPCATGKEEAGAADVLSSPDLATDTLWIDPEVGSGSEDANPAETGVGFESGPDLPSDAAPNPAEDAVADGLVGTDGCCAPDFAPDGRAPVDNRVEDIAATADGAYPADAAAKDAEPKSEPASAEGDGSGCSSSFASPASPWLALLVMLTLATLLSCRRRPS
jgi:MYXO-CTERM domain-containing protein